MIFLHLLHKLSLVLISRNIFDHMIKFLRPRNEHKLAPHERFYTKTEFWSIKIGFLLDKMDIFDNITSSVHKSSSTLVLLNTIEHMR